MLSVCSEQLKQELPENPIQHHLLSALNLSIQDLILFVVINVFFTWSFCAPLLFLQFWLTLRDIQFTQFLKV